MPEQTANLESWLPDFLAAFLNTMSDLSDRIVDYRRHYGGFVSNGHVSVMVNAFCDAGSDDWALRPIVAMDGSDCFST